MADSGEEFFFNPRLDPSSFKMLDTPPPSVQSYMEKKNIFENAFKALILSFHFSASARPISETV
jgi:hypothetical protein